MMFSRGKAPQKIQNKMPTPVLQSIWANMLHELGIVLLEEKSRSPQGQWPYQIQAEKELLECALNGILKHKTPLSALETWAIFLVCDHYRQSLVHSSCKELSEEQMSAIMKASALKEKGSVTPKLIAYLSEYFNALSQAFEGFLKLNCTWGVEQNPKNYCVGLKYYIEQFKVLYESTLGQQQATERPDSIQRYASWINPLQNVWVNMQNIIKNCNTHPYLDAKKMREQQLELLSQKTVQAKQLIDDVRNANLIECYPSTILPNEWVKVKERVLKREIYVVYFQNKRWFAGYCDKKNRVYCQLELGSRFGFDAHTTAPIIRDVGLLARLQSHLNGVGAQTLESSHVDACLHRFVDTMYAFFLEQLLKAHTAPEKEIQAKDNPLPLSFEALTNTLEDEEKRIVTNECLEFYQFLALIADPKGNKATISTKYKQLLGLFHTDKLQQNAQKHGFFKNQCSFSEGFLKASNQLFQKTQEAYKGWERNSASLVSLEHIQDEIKRLSDKLRLSEGNNQNRISNCNNH